MALKLRTCYNIVTKALIFKNLCPYIISPKLLPILETPDLL